MRCHCLQVAGKLTSEDKAAAEKAVEEAVQWLDANQLAEEDEFKFRREELEKTVSPIMMRMYQGDGSAEMPSGMGGVPGSGATNGPTVEVGWP